MFHSIEREVKGVSHWNYMDIQGRYRDAQHGALCGRENLLSLQDRGAFIF